MILIEKIEFSNYRQYKNSTINFKNNGVYNMHILRAKNGTGKTTFLNGIVWCLYGKEYFLSDSSKALRIVNESAIQDANVDDIVEASVKITIVDDDNKRIVFDRSLSFKVVTDPLTERKKALPITPSSIFKVSEIPINSSENSTIYESDEDTKNIVQQYFNEDIYSYYFFDGENLKNYFDSNNSEKVKNSILTLSQVKLLQTSINRTESIASEKSKELTKKSGTNNLKIYDDIDKMEDENKNYENEIRQVDKEIPIIELRMNDLNDQLNGYKPIQNKQARRNELDKYCRQLKSDQQEFWASKKEFIRTYLVYFNLYPRIKSTLEMIKYKEEHGELPPKIDKNQIEELIANHAENCPMCDGEINDHAIVHMKQLLDKLDVSSQTSNYLSSIKGGLENAIRECKKYSKKRDELIKKEKYFEEEIKQTEEELDTISKYLSSYTDETGSLFNVSKLEKERQTAKEELDAKVRKRANAEILLDINNKKLEELKKEVTEMEKNIGERNTLQKQIELLRNLSETFKLVKKNLMDEIKIEIEKNTWELFKNMIWKKNTFYKLEIDDSYQMSVYNNNLNEIIGSTSATEKMALAYAFTLAIHETSGRNCPLVVDSPLGRVSDENRINMANELLNISKNKQIIMLFTPDEYSEQVASKYDNVVSSVRDLSLSEDENEIQKVEA